MFQIRKLFWRKTVLIAFLPISCSVTCVLGAQTRRLIATVLLSNHNICFGWKTRNDFQLLHTKYYLLQTVHRRQFAKEILLTLTSFRLSPYRCGNSSTFAAETTSLFEETDFQSPSGEFHYRGSKYHYKWAIIGPPAKRHLNGVSLAGRWWWPTIEC